MKWMILIGFGVLSSLVTRVSSVELGHAERKEAAFQEDDRDLLEDAYRLFIDNGHDDLDEAELMNDDVMLANWFKKAGHSFSHWTKKAAHDAGRWTKKAGHDAGKWTKKAGHDAGKWTKKAAQDVGHAVKKGCHVVNQIPFKELVSRMNEELHSRGVSEEDINEEQFAAAYEGIKNVCKVIG